MSAELKALIVPGKVLVLSKTTCGYCSAAKLLLNQLNIKRLEIVELNTIGNGRDLQDAAADLTGQSTVPNIWVGTQHVGGNSDVQAMFKSGELSKLLKNQHCI